MPLNIDWQQILLHLFNFVVLFAILYFLLYKPVKQFIGKRAEYYKKIDDKANETLNEAEKAKEEYQNRLSSFEEEISLERAKAHKEIEEAREAKIRRAEDEAAKIIADAHKNIRNDHLRMLQEAQTEIADMVASAAEKLVSQSSTSQAFDQFLDTAERGEADE